MTKDYVTIKEENFNILGHKVKAITERFSVEYLGSKRFQPRCLRCCFYSGQPRYEGPPRICLYINCRQHGHEATHFELDNEDS